MGPESTLSWLGFSDAGTPAMQDSLGMLSLYLLRSEVWVPYCDTSKNVSGSFIEYFSTLIKVFYLANCDCRWIFYNSSG